MLLGGILMSSSPPAANDCSTIDLSAFKHVDPNEEKVYADLVRNLIICKKRKAYWTRSHQKLSA